MSRDFSTTIIGTMTRDVELRYSASGLAFGKFGLACREAKKGSDGNFEEADATFVDCTVFGQMAENAAESFGKGARVIVVGTVSMDRWDDKDTGAKRTKLAVTVDEVGPSVRWATCEVVKNERSTTTAGNRPPTRATVPAGGGYDLDEAPF